MPIPSYVTKDHSPLQKNLTAMNDTSQFLLAKLAPEKQKYRKPATKTSHIGMVGPRRVSADDLVLENRFQLAQTN